MRGRHDLLLTSLGEQHPDPVRPSLARRRTQDIGTIAAEASCIGPTPECGRFTSKLMGGWWRRRERWRTRNISHD